MSTTFAEPPSFRCPVCGAVSHNPNDLANGYCGRCHDWTGEPVNRIPCTRCVLDAQGNIIPDPECEIHWHRVIDGGDTPPAWVFP